MIHSLRLTLAVSILLAGAAASHAEGTWKLVANHLHSSSGGDTHWSRGIRHIREYCAENRIDHAILTDHDTIGGWFDPAFKSGAGAELIPGQEWTSSEGHANLVGFSASGPQGAIKPEGSSDYDGFRPPLPTGIIDHAKMVQEVHGRGGLVFINHPALRGYKWPEDTFGADSCEVNGTWENSSGVNAKAWYVRRLVAGQRIGAVGGSDYHYLRPKRRGFFTPQIDEPINLVLAEGPGLAGIQTGFKARHVQVLANPKAPRCELQVDTNADGRADGIGGDMLTVRLDQPVKLTVRVTGGLGQQLTIHDVTAGRNASYTTAQIPITSDDFTTTLARTGSGVLRRATFCEVGALKTLTNPIWY